ncbi:MAG TPA: hypothetical protein V6D43_11410 [Candidatus Sericytochromatia bacterium]
MINLLQLFRNNRWGIRGLSGAEHTGQPRINLPYQTRSQVVSPIVNLFDIKFCKLTLLLTTLKFNIKP